MKSVLAIIGPTATGKTDIAIKVAQELSLKGQKAEIINVDSLLFYKEIAIGTAKPSLSELEITPHHLINICSINEPMNAASFSEKAKPLVEEIHQRNSVPILTGGSAFYLRALIKGMYQTEPPDIELRKELEELFREEGISPFREYLQRNDPQSFEKIHENDTYRTMRAVQHHRQTGALFSDEKKEFDRRSPYDFSTPENPNLHFEIIYLDLPKPIHWKIIQKRTNQMIENGLIQEVETLLSQGFSKEAKPLQSIGYKETIQYLDGLIKTKQDLIERISISTRQLAKSQRTFFKKVTPKINFHSIDEREKIIQYATSKLITKEVINDEPK